MRIKKVALIAASLLWGCSEIFGTPPLEYLGAVSYFDGPLFFPLWDELKACSKLSGKLRSFHFYYVKETSLHDSLHGIRTLGAYLPETNRIFIVELEKKNPAVIRHEMMHALLRDYRGHPPLYFASDGLCGYV